MPADEASTTVAVILSTHTTRHLRPAVLALAQQARLPDHVIVTCDADAPAIGRELAAVSNECPFAVWLVRRCFAGQSRSAQVRNNGVRCLLDHWPPLDPARTMLAFLDGDCVAPPDHVLRVAELSARADVLLGWRLELTEAQTESFDETALLAGRPPVRVTGQQQQELARRHAKLRRQALLRWVGATKPHKPKLLSANFAVRLDAMLAVNGFDESFEGYGQEDDDLGRRLLALGARVRVAVRDLPVLHLHHPTRAPSAWSASPGAARLEGPFEVRAREGIDHPRAQACVECVRIEHGRRLAVRLLAAGGARDAAPAGGAPEERREPAQRGEQGAQNGQPGGGGGHQGSAEGEPQPGARRV